ncbi:prolyl oligopeptidase family serine peptidase [Acidicapsa ligni]|uniref:prolyl oligopeptidase family serine peptidase n=1 Tax=Acidicapsa ligni TaxID=542300 RepID=UPI0021E071A9|nr:prolyl oligopeptidase family serine peptidase [Acidicapsa ligni]
MSSAITSPQAESGSTTFIRHGIKVEDCFRWLEDQDSPATRTFIREEQGRFRGYLRNHARLRASIEDRVRTLLSVEVVGIPIPDRRGGLLFLKRRAEEEQSSIHNRDKMGVEHKLISIDSLGLDVHTSLAILRVSPSGRYLVFGVRTGGEDVQDIHIYDLVQGCLLSDRIPRGFYRGLVFSAKEEGFYYVQEETDGKYLARRAVRYHTLGSDQRADNEIFYGGDGPALRLIVQDSIDASSLGYLMVSLDSEPRSQFFIHPISTGQPARQIVNLRGARLGVRLSDTRIEALTTYAAPLGRIVSIPVDDPTPDSWVDVVPEATESLYSYEHWGSAIVAHYLHGHITITRVYSSSGRLVREIRYPETGTAVIGQVDAVNDRLFYGHSDIALPPTIYAVDLRTGESVRWWQQADLLPVDKPAAESHTYRSKDGVQIPITLVRPKDQVKGGPLLLSAYGGGGVSNSPRFSVLLAVLIEAGFTCATAHVRGGGEGGLEWQLAAARERKQISVDDLLGAANWLIEEGYTSSQQLGIAGQSHGALLALCAMTQEPQLFRAVVALGPITDLTRFHLFGVARGAISEFGSPDNPDEFASLHRLSPFHRISKELSYPATLIISGDRDKRCDALHARKMIAQLRTVRRQEHPIVLDYTEHRGHKPVLPLGDRIQALTSRLSFLIAELGEVSPSKEAI